MREALKAGACALAAGAGAKLVEKLVSFVWRLVVKEMPDEIHFQCPHCEEEVTASLVDSE